MHAIIWSENLRGRDHSKDLSVDNIRMNLREIGWRGVDGIHVTLDRDQ
jgi:hypothetical protein